MHFQWPRKTIGENKSSLGIDLKQITSTWQNSKTILYLFRVLSVMYMYMCMLISLLFISRAIHCSGLEDLLLYIASSEDERNFSMHVLEIVSLMFREQVHVTLYVHNWRHSVH